MWKKWIFALFILGWSFGFLPEGQARSTRLQERKTCLSPFRIQRGGTPGCWVSYRYQPEETLCIPFSLWKQIRANPEDTLCGTFLGKSRKLETDYARFYVRAFQADPPVEKGRSRRIESLQWKIENLRETWSGRLRSSDSYGVFRQLLLHEKARDAPVDWLRRLGMVHLFTASGIHLYVLWRLSHAGILRAASSVGWNGIWAFRCSAAVSTTFWILAWALSGWRPGLLRPALVAGARLTGTRLGFRWRPFSPLVIALLIDGVIGIGRGEWQGVWMHARVHYALAVGGAIWALQSSSFRTGLLRLALGSWVFCAIWDIFLGEWVSFATPFLNLITTPIYAFYYPLTLLGLLGMSLYEALSGVPLLWGLRVLEGLTLGANTWAAFCAEISLRWFSLWKIPPSALLWGAFLFGCVWVFFRHVKRRTQMIAGLIIAAIGGLRVSLMNGSINEWRGVNSGEAETVVQLDVGQGDSALVVTRHGNTKSAGLIDTGSERAKSALEWMSALHEQGVSSLRWIALTHLDEDHVGALKILLPILSIDCVFTSPQVWKTERGKSWKEVLETFQVEAKSQSFGCYPFAWTDLSLSSRTQKGNAQMTGYWIPWGEEGIYLNLGDAGRTQEKKAISWIQKEKKRLGEGFERRHRVLKVSHHGSRTSTDPKLLSAFLPQEAWLSLGKMNPHGHPTYEVLKRLKSFGIEMRRTDQEGNLSGNFSKRPK